MNEFKKYATKHLGISTLNLETYVKQSNIQCNYINPTIIEERQLNVAQMDVFSRLMMDRIIFLGTGINDYVSNIIQAQLLFLESTDPEKDIQIYINSGGGGVYAGLGIYDTMQYIKPDVATICTGMAASMAALAAAISPKMAKTPSATHRVAQLASPVATIIRFQTIGFLALKAILARPTSNLPAPLERANFAT